jgi:hypothetical protein
MRVTPTSCVVTMVTHVNVNHITNNTKRILCTNKDDLGPREDRRALMVAASGSSSALDEGPLSRELSVTEGGIAKEMNGGLP